MVSGLPRFGGKSEEFLHDAGLHLIGCLVGKGHRQNMPVRISVIAFKQQSYVFSGEVIGLARTCRSLHYLNHLPQMFLKSQYSHTFASVVLLNGTDVSYISSRRVFILSETASQNTLLRGTVTGGSLKREEVE